MDRAAARSPRTPGLSRSRRPPAPARRPVRRTSRPAPVAAGRRVRGRRAAATTRAVREGVCWGSTTVALIVGGVIEGDGGVRVGPSRGARSCLRPHSPWPASAVEGQSLAGRQRRRAPESSRPLRWTPARARPAGPPPGRGERQRPGHRLAASPLEAGMQLIAWADRRRPSQPGRTPAARSAVRPASSATRSERVGEEFRMPPQRLAVSSPDQPDLPARQRLVGVPPALAVLNEATRAERCRRTAPPADRRAPASGRRRPPPSTPEPAVRHRRTKVGSPPMVSSRPAALSRRSTSAPSRCRAEPLIRRVGLIGATVVGEPVHGVAEIEVDLAGPGGPGDRRRLQRAGRCGQRDVPLAGQQGRGRIETDPAGSRHVRLRPGVQIGRVALLPSHSPLIRSFLASSPSSLSCTR